MITNRSILVTSARRLFVAGLMAGLIGCSTRREVFTDRSADEVWTAMVAVARTPDYQSGEPGRRWTVRQNNVWVDEQQQRIEIDRTLEHVHQQPGFKPLHEERRYKFTVRLEAVEPPTAALTSRGVGVPAHAWDEADRYFSEVWNVLGSERPPQPPDWVEASLDEPQAADPARTLYDN